MSYKIYQMASALRGGHDRTRKIAQTGQRSNTLSIIRTLGETAKHTRTVAETLQRRNAVPIIRTLAETGKRFLDALLAFPLLALFTSYN